MGQRWGSPWNGLRLGLVCVHPTHPPDTASVWDIPSSFKQVNLIVFLCSKFESLGLMES